MRAAVIVLLAAAPAYADDRAEAEALFKAGTRAFDAGDFAQAAEAFEQAYARLPLPAIAFSTAQAQRLQYFIDDQPARLERAVALYRLYIDQQKTGGRVTDAASHLAELEPLLRTLRAKGPIEAAPPNKTRLLVLADADGAHVAIDGKAAASVAEVSAGEHVVTVEAAGYETATLKATAIEGATIPVEVQLAAKPATLVVRAPEGAKITVDGKPVGATAHLPAGKHALAVQLRGHVALSQAFELGRGDVVEVNAPLPATTQRKVARVALWTGGALAVATGIAAGLAYKSDRDAVDLRDRITTGGLGPADLAGYDDLVAERDHRVSITLGLGTAAAAVAVTGALLYWFDNPPAIEVAPVVTPAGTGATVRVRF